jgi:FkbM family methyltransferase
LISGYWESWITICFYRLFKLAKPLSVINVGANVGYYSLLASSFDRDMPVIAYEPQKKLASLIRRSAVVNGMSNLRVVESAVGASAGTVWLRTFEGFYGSAMVSSVSTAGEHAFGVPVINLDSVDLTPIDFLIVDAEGFEFQIISGARSRLKSAERCAVLLEFSSSRYDNLVQFVDLLEELDFVPYSINHLGSLVNVKYADLRVELKVIDLVLVRNVDVSSLLV